jgi:hypothetical protein
VKQNPDWLQFKNSFETKWDEISPELEKLYENYVNKDKLINLFKAWFYIFYVLIYNTNDTVKQKFEKFNGSIFLFNTRPNSKSIKKTKRSNFFNILANLYFTYFDIILMRGAIPKNKFDKILIRINLFFKSHLKIIENDFIKIQLIEILYKNKFTKDFIILFDKKLPKIFFSQQIYLSSINKLYCEGSAHAFFDFDGYENLLLLNRKINISGRQHGGGYGMFVDDLYLEFELKLCDEFIGWNLFSKNEMTNICKPLKNISNKKGVIILIARPSIPSWFVYLTPHFYNELLDTSTIDYLHKEINHLNIGINCKPHPIEGLNQFYKKIIFFKIYNAKEKAENIINRNDLVIFDVISHTLIYFCLYHSIRFIVLFNADNYEFLSENMKIWLNRLHKNNIVIYTHENNKLYNILNSFNQ